MSNQVSTAETDSLRYLEANAVNCPTGKLEGLCVISQDDEALGVVNGVLIDPVTRKLRYLVSADTPAVMLPDDRLRVDEPFESIERQRFDARAVPRFSDDDLMTAMFSGSMP
jgi:PRC-barrel domain